MLKKSATNGKRHPLNMRTTHDTRTRLEAAAKTAGRSLAQEVEYRLDKSFDRDRGIEQTVSDWPPFKTAPRDGTVIVGVLALDGGIVITAPFKWNGRKWINSSGKKANLPATPTKWAHYEMLGLGHYPFKF